MLTPVPAWPTVEHVVLALRPAREASDSVDLPQRVEPLGAAVSSLWA
jgi:hypothetical protein